MQTQFPPFPEKGKEKFARVHAFAKSVSNINWQSIFEGVLESAYWEFKHEAFLGFPIKETRAALLDIVTPSRYFILPVYFSRNNSLLLRSYHQRIIKILYRLLVLRKNYFFSYVKFPRKTFFLFFFFSN